MAYNPFRNPGMKALSLLFATLLWLTVSRDSQVERSLQVPLEFQNMPASLEIVGETPSTATVRLRGASSLLDVDRSLKEIGPGIYSGRARVPVAGQYDVAFLLDNPRILHCFSAQAQENPSLRKDGRALTAQFVDLPLRVRQGAPLTIRVYKLLDATTGAPRIGLADVHLLFHATPGGPRGETAAGEVGDGVYEAPIVPGQPGVHYLFVTVPSLDMKPSQLPYRGIVVEGPGAQAAHVAGPS